ncbi:hypothetical protein A6A06_12875 [Streptomyces sp. CB02923]|uniref:DUF6355 family natural product biosynthesis protein n=1 Tax=Streptomyces sp. CB02923 TaxID=1718985 RepID=UPI00093957E9|nr:DUF6355 family natural product biosynthesis protein [Streptomyces sp. CB02923]OKI02000.1 hypothetical protein A6A06_12875 [Streptomyces sp. CB02923]
MSLRRSLLATLGAAALTLGMTIAAAPDASADPCGFYETSRDAYYHHCTSDGSRVIIEVEVFGPNYERCVGPGVTWLGSSGKIDGAHYVGRTC